MLRKKAVSGSFCCFPQLAFSVFDSDSLLRILYYSVGILIDMVKSVIHEYTLLPVVLLIIINASLTVITKLFKPAIIMNNGWMKERLIRPLFTLSAASSERYLPSCFILK